jgi:diguanylate cyclase (GGDEF)-like protein
VRQDEFLLAILGVTILVNVLLVVASWAQAHRLRRSGGRRARPLHGELSARPATRLSESDRQDDRRVAAAVEAFVADVSADAAGSVHLPTSDEVLARRQEVLGGVPVTGAKADDRHPAGLDGLADAVTWERILREESARAARFRRPSTVVTACLTHLEHLADRSGRNAADRVVAETLRLLESEARAVDRIVRLSDSTFGILLPETGELGASRYAERVRTAADAWLASAGLSVRLELDWASLPDEGEVDALMSAARLRKGKAAGV